MPEVSDTTESARTIRPIVALGPHDVAFDQEEGLGTQSALLSVLIAPPERAAVNASFPTLRLTTHDSR